MDCDSEQFMRNTSLDSLVRDSGFDRVQLAVFQPATLAPGAAWNEPYPRRIQQRLPPPRNSSRADRKAPLLLDSAAAARESNYARCRLFRCASDHRAGRLRRSSRDE